MSSFIFQQQTYFSCLKVYRFDYRLVPIYSCLKKFALYDYETDRIYYFLHTFTARVCVCVYLMCRLQVCARYIYIYIQVVGTSFSAVNNDRMTYLQVCVIESARVNTLVQIYIYTINIPCMHVCSVYTTYMVHDTKYAVQRRDILPSVRLDFNV